MKSKKKGILQSSGFLNDDGFGINEGLLQFEQNLFEKARTKKVLDRKIRFCKRCPGLNQKGTTESAPGWGSLSADIFFVGQSLCTQCMLTAIPFTEKSGYFLDVALRLSNLRRTDVFITNVVHCHPPRNRQSSNEEVNNCLPYLYDELNIVRPRVIFPLGKDASKSIAVCRRLKFKFRTKIVALTHPAAFLYTRSQEQLKDWLIGTSMEIDKWLKKE